MTAPVETTAAMTPPAEQHDPRVSLLLLFRPPVPLP